MRSGGESSASLSDTVLIFATSGQASGKMWGCHCAPCARITSILLVARPLRQDSPSMCEWRFPRATR